MNSGSYLFFFPPKGPREGRWLRRWCRRIWQLGLLHSPSPPSQVQGKGRAGQRGHPVALLSLIQADTWGHVSHAHPALRHQLACLSLPRFSTERGAFRSPCWEPAGARYLLFPGFSIFCWNCPPWGRHSLSSGVLYSVPLLLSEVLFLLILLLLS